MMGRAWAGGFAPLFLFFLLAAGATAAGASPLPAFDFRRDTFAFANETVFDYREGQAHLRHGRASSGPPPYNRRCFIMSKAADQFRKFARFDPAQPAPDDATLARLVRAVARRPAWGRPRPAAGRIVIPGYADLRALSAARPGVLQENIGLGWPTYVRVGNWRMVFLRGGAYQAATHASLEAALARGDVFCGFLTTFPRLYINHAILVYGRRPPGRGDGSEHYRVYDPNHPESPRDLAYDPAKRVFSYQKDWDFIGGTVTVLQIYNYWGQ